MATESEHGSLRELRAQIEHAAGRRADLLRALSDQHDRQLVAACARLDGAGLTVNVVLLEPEQL